RVGRIQFIILALILSGFGFFGQPFINFWAGEGYENAYYVAMLLIVPVTVPLIQNLGIEIQRAKNMHKARSIVYFFIAIANVFISIPLIKLFGPAGAAFGTAISLTVGNIFFMNWYYHNRIGLNMFYYWKSIAGFISALIIPLVLGVVINLFVSVNSLIVLLVCIVIYASVYCLSMWFIGMNDYERGFITEPLKKILKKK
ncbi:MAG: oligosaccharide flippase family protein, partial [Eubacterium sp.]|nr:oligosaccharide flippase family protein [Eubacterium sp.]